LEKKYVEDEELDIKILHYINEVNDTLMLKRKVQSWHILFLSYFSESFKERKLYSLI